MPSLILPGSQRLIRERPRSLRRSTRFTLGNGLLGYWPFDEGCGATAYDWIGSSNCTLAGGVEWRGVGGDARFGRRPWFDGTNDAGSLPCNLNYPQATISIWFWWDTYAQDDKPLLELTPIYWQNSGGILIDPNGAGIWDAEFAFAHHCGTSVSATISRPSARVWRHVLVKHDVSVSSNEITHVYLDGVSQTLFRPENGNNTLNFANSTMYLMSRAGTSLFATGSIAHLGIWNRLLTEEECVRLARLPNAIRDGLGVRGGKKIFFVPGGTVANTTTILGGAGLLTSPTTTIIGGAGLLESKTTTVLGGAGLIVSPTTTILGGSGLLEAKTTTIIGGSGLVAAKTTTVIGGSGLLEIKTITVLGGSGLLEIKTTTVLGGSGLLEAKTTTILGGAGLVEAKTTTIIGGSRLFSTPTTTILGGSGLTDGTAVLILGGSGLREAKTTTVLGGSGLLEIKTTTILGGSRLLEAKTTTVLGGSGIFEIKTITVLGGSGLSGSTPSSGTKIYGSVGTKVVGKFRRTQQSEVNPTDRVKENPTEGGLT